ncbi:MAG: hypothetical protein PUF59_08925 [Lachnospiraceae bacterium]|nr:hypothetical protein [Lachnospiraceae bacterium]
MEQLHAVLQTWWIPLDLLVLLFFTFSFLGWCMEVTLKYIQFHRFINRGFLIGPCLPIYGTGVTVITLSVYLVGGEFRTISGVFLASMISSGALEYFSSWIMEKLFHARWWDYSQKPMNLHGRIWIGNLLLFGLAGVILSEIVVPPVMMFYLRIPAIIRWIVSGVLAVTAIVDAVVSYGITSTVKKEMYQYSGRDNTEEVSRVVRETLSNRSLLYRRLMEAYPNMKVSMSRVEAALEKNRIRMQKRLEKECARVQKGIEQSKEMVQQGKEAVSQSIEQSCEKLQQSKEAVSQSIEQSREKLQQSKEVVGQSLEQTKERVQEKIDELRNGEKEK